MHIRSGWSLLHLPPLLCCAPNLAEVNASSNDLDLGSGPGVYRSHGMPALASCAGSLEVRWLCAITLPHTCLN